MTYEGEAVRRASFAEVASARRAACRGPRRASVCARGEPVATFCLNHQEHLEAYLAVPSMGAVLHTLNVRLFPDQLAYVIDHAEDKVIIADARSRQPLPGCAAGGRASSTSSSSEKVTRPQLGDDPLLRGAHRRRRRRALPGPISPRPRRPPCATRAARPGRPKGVVYSHRSTYLHSLAATSSAAARDLRLRPDPRRRPAVPRQRLGRPLCRLAERGGPDHAQAVPARASRSCGSSRPSARLSPAPSRRSGARCFRYAKEHGSDLSSFRSILCGGAAVPRALMERFDKLFGVPIMQGWGMTETSPLGAVALPPRDAAPEREIDYRSKTGRVELRGRGPRRRRRGQPVPARRHLGRRVRDQGTLDNGRVLRRPDTRTLRRRLAPHRRRRHLGRRRLHADHGPDQGRHQDRRGVDLFCRARERPHGTPRRGGGGRRGGARRALG